MKHFFNFIYPLSIGLVEIDEPIGIDSVPFVLKQRENSMGRDVSYAGSNEAKFTIHKKFNQSFEYMLRAWEQKGFEIQVEQLVDFGDGMVSQGFVSDITTNNYDTITYILKQSREKQKFNRNYDTPANLLSDKDIYGNAIQRPQLYKVLANAIPVEKQSTWKLTPFQTSTYDTDPGGVQQVANLPNEFAFNQNGVYFNPNQQQDKYDIDDSLSGGITNANSTSADSFRYIRARQNIENLKIRFDLDVLYKYRPNEFIGGLDKAGSLGLYVYWGQTLDVSQATPIWYDGSDQETDRDIQLPSVIETVIPYLNQTDYVWIYWRVGSLNGAVNRIVFKSALITANATQVADSTVVNCIRLVDAVRYTVKSTTGLDINAPKYDNGGKYYPIMITSSALMRYIFDKPFNISIKDIVEDGLPFANGDYQIMPDNTVFFGSTRDDFYRDYESGAYIGVALEDYEQYTNERAFVKAINLRFSKYASLKEVPIDGTYGIIHGESEAKTPNENADNVLDITINWPFDPYYFEDERIKSFEYDKETATQDNSTIFPLDTWALPAGKSITVTKLLRHELSVATVGGIVTLVNTGDFSFIQLGIVANSQIQIINTVNANTYTVIKVDNNRLEILPVSGDIFNIEAENTRFRYFIDPIVVLQTRTNQGITNISGISNGNRFGNLAYSSDRILRTVYADNIATATLYHPNELVRNTLYKNNPGAQTTIDGITIKEGDNYIGYDGVNHPTLNGMVSKFTMIMSYNEMTELYNSIQVNMGYIRYIQPNGYPVKLYPTELNATAIGKGKKDYKMLITGVGEELFEPYYMNIQTGESGNIYINNNIAPSGIRFVVRKGKLRILDTNGLLLNPEIPYQRVRINGTGFDSVSAFSSALKAISV